MTDFRFESPAYLLLLVGLVFFYYLIQKIQGRSDNALLRFVSAKNLSQLLKGRTGTSSMLRKYALWLGLASLVIALARPQANPILEERDQASLDIMIMLDISRSMDAEDIAPSRIKKAKRTITRLLEQLSGDRVGLIAFAGSSALIIPLTSDYEMIKSSLINVDTSLIEGQGTNFASALNLGLTAMQRGAQTAGSKIQRTNIFLLMSDGEDHHKEDLDAVDQIRNKNGIIFSIAFGTEKGVPIPVRDARGELAGYKRDRAGNPVVTKVNPASLQQIAERGGGQFYFSTADEGEIFDILKRTQGIQRVGGATIKAKMYQEYFYPFLAAGFLLLMFTFIPVRWMFQQIIGFRFKKAAPAILFFLSLFPQQSHAHPLSFLWSKEKKASEESLALAKQGKIDEAISNLKTLQADNPDSPELNYNMGTYMLEGKKYAEGRAQLESQKDSPLKDASLYNIAGSYAQEGKKDEARAGYAELIQSLNSKEKLSEKEKVLLENAKANLAHLSNAQNDKKQNQQQSSGGGDKPEQNQDNKDKKDQEQKNDESKGGKDSKDDKKEGDGDNKDKSDKPKDDKKDENKDQKDQDKPKDDQGNNQNQDQQNQQNQQQQQQNQTPSHGRQPFKERQDMGEEEAKQILEALKQQESKLQKKFLKNKDGKSKLDNDDDPKDW